MKTFHEAPLYYMDLVDKLTDGTYFLVHLFQEHDEYLDHALQLAETDRFTILDNSVFELETPFDPETFASWINVVRPTEYIIPDVLENAAQTIQNIQDWNKTFKRDTPKQCRTIGVVQGATYQEIVTCYKEIEPLVDKVAISFDYSCYTDILQREEVDLKHLKTLQFWCYGRERLLEKLVTENIINTNKPHHLLGGSLVSEWRAYRDYKWIDSIDTSSPVMWALEKKLYTTEIYKPKTKLFTLIDFKPSSIEEDIDITSKMVQNIQTFRKACNG